MIVIILNFGIILSTRYHTVVATMLSFINIHYTRYTFLKYKLGLTFHVFNFFLSFVCRKN